ncbi:MAG: hypothetical protein AB7O37_06165 [Vicinamibacteria bacterium]
MSATPIPLPPQLGVLGQRARAVGILAAVLCLVGAFTNPDQLYRSYLFGFLFWVGVAVGSLGLLMIHHLSGGVWGLGIRRILEAASRTLFFGVLAFAPVWLGIGRLFSWSHADVVARDPLVQQKAAYLNVPFFTARALFYFACWSLLAHFLSKWSLERDRTNDARFSERLQGISGGGLVLLGLTITFSSVDWAMSLNPHWYSTIYGVLFMVGQVLSALAFVILLIALIGHEKPLVDVISREAVHDLGKLLLAFVMLWAYMGVSQLIIVWSANLPEEIPWYIQRFEGGWRVIAVLLLVFHFALPFLMLLSRELKRNLRALALVAGGLFAVRLLDLFWLIAPDLQGHGSHGFQLHWLDLVAPTAIGGLWIALFERELRSRPLLTPGDPELAELLGK